MAALVPLPDPFTGGGRGDEIEPVQAGVRRFSGDYLHEVAVLQWCGQWTEAIVNTDSLAVVAHFTVDAVSKIHGGGAFA